MLHMGVSFIQSTADHIIFAVSGSPIRFTFGDSTKRHLFYKITKSCVKVAQSSKNHEITATILPLSETKKP